MITTTITKKMKNWIEGKNKLRTYHCCTTKRRLNGPPPIPTILSAAAPSAFSSGILRRRIRNNAVLVGDSEILENRVRSSERAVLHAAAAGSGSETREQRLLVAFIRWPSGLHYKILEPPQEGFGTAEIITTNMKSFFLTSWRKRERREGGVVWDFVGHVMSLLVCWTHHHHHRVQKRQRRSDSSKGKTDNIYISRETWISQVFLTNKSCLFIYWLDLFLSLFFSKIYTQFILLHEKNLGEEMMSLS